MTGSGYTLDLGGVRAVAGRLGLWPAGVTVDLFSGLGNQLFQYCFARILAERHGLALRCRFVPPSGGVLHSNRRLAVREVFDVATRAPGRTATGRPRRLGGHAVDLEALDGTRPLHLHGFFQQYRYYRPYRRSIASWLSVAAVELPSVDPEAVAVHVRLGDYLSAIRERPYAFRPRYYDEAIDRAGGGPVVVVTDEPAHPTIEHLRRRHGAAVVSSADPYEDFRRLMAHRRLVTSESTFCWWAGWLGRAERIVQPPRALDPAVYGGFWSDREDIDLFVDDDDRYVNLG